MLAVRDANNVGTCTSSLFLLLHDRSLYIVSSPCVVFTESLFISTGSENDDSISTSNNPVPITRRSLPKLVSTFTASAVNTVPLKEESTLTSKIPLPIIVVLPVDVSIVSLSSTVGTCIFKIPSPMMFVSPSSVSIVT